MSFLSIRTVRSTTAAFVLLLNYFNSLFCRLPIIFPWLHLQRKKSQNVFLICPQLCCYSLHLSIMTLNKLLATDFIILQTTSIHPSLTSDKKNHLCLKSALMPISTTKSLNFHALSLIHNPKTFLKTGKTQTTTSFQWPAFIAGPEAEHCFLAIK